MDIERLRKIDDELEQINQTYSIFDEDTRLKRSAATRVEFLTPAKYIRKYLKPGMRILDIGAGAGEYSLHFATNGYDVDALELSDNNVQAFARKIQPGMQVRLRQGNAADLSHYDDESFDVVLLMGPLYHFHGKHDRSRCIREAKRVCKKDGTLFFSFISHDMVFMTELAYDPKYFSIGDYDHETLRLNDFPFAFFTPPECREMLTDEDIRILHEVASDGASELMGEKINRMGKTDYAQYLRYHFYRCEKPEMLGFSNHLLFVGQKR